MTDQMTTQFDHYIENALSQRCQNEAIRRIREGKWFTGRVVGIIKPIPLIADICKHILFGFGNIIAYAPANLTVYVVSRIKKRPYQAPCSIPGAMRHFALGVKFTSDILPSPIINFIDATLYNNKQKELNDLQKTFPQRIQQLSAEKTQLEGSIAQKESQFNAQLSHAHQTNQSKDQQLQALEGTLNTLRGEKSVVEQTLASTEAALQTAQTKTASLEGHLHDAHQRANQLQLNLNTLRSEKLGLEQNLSSTQTALQTAQTEINSLQAQLHDANQRVQGLQTIVDTLRTEKSDLEQNLFSTQALLQLTQQNASNIQQQLDQAKTDSDTKDLNHGLLSAHLTNLSEENDRLKQTLDSKESELQASQSRVQNLLLHGASTEEQRQAWENQVTTEKLRADQLVKALEGAENEKSALVQRLNEQEAENRRLKERNVKLIEDSGREMALLTDQNKQLSEQLMTSSTGLPKTKSLQNLAKTSSSSSTETQPWESAKTAIQKALNQRTAYKGYLTWQNKLDNLNCKSPTEFSQFCKNLFRQKQFLSSETKTKLITSIRTYIPAWAP